MKRIILASILFFAVGRSIAQSLNGQWKGAFDAHGDIVVSGDNATEYILELNIDGENVSGYSYSYFDNRTYFVICQISGTYDKKNKKLFVIETKRIKGHTPPDWNDCLQAHTLVYKKEGNTELLTGTWGPAVSQLSDCGTGNTTLSRKTLSSLSSYNKPAKQQIAGKTKSAVKAPPALYAAPQDIKDSSKTDPVTQIEVQHTATPQSAAVPESMTSVNNYEKRTDVVLKTIEVENETFKLDIYDNGAIDGDSISLFYNGKVILSHKRLSDKPISLTLSVNNNHPVNELTMYAENLGELPPNTALMIITDGSKRYEVNISSDLQKSGSIRFTHNPPSGTSP